MEYMKWYGDGKENKIEWDEWERQRETKKEWDKKMAITSKFPM